MKLLHIDSSILGDGSVSRQLSAAIVERLSCADAPAEVVYRDLAADPVAHITADVLPELAAGKEVEQFLAAHVIVIGAGFYNFTIPSQLKAWIDRILVKGRTFTYHETGPVGLAGAKRVVVAIARGGVYHVGSPMAEMEHAERLLRTVFAFIGVNPEFIVADGTAISEAARRDAVTAALAKVRDLEFPPRVAMSRVANLI